MKRARPDEREAKALLHAGACDRLARRASREEMLWHLPALPAAGNHAGSFRRARAPATGHPPGQPDRAPAPGIPGAGLLTGHHPIVLFEDALKNARSIKAGDLASHVGRRVRFAGWLITGKTVFTSQMQGMQFLTFEDESGLVEATLFPRSTAASI